MIAVQQVVDGAVVIRFQPAPHSRSLAGAARPYIQRWPEKDVLESMEDAWGDAADERYREGLRETSRPE